MSDMKGSYASITSSLVVGAAILASTGLAAHAAGSGWLVLAGPLLLAIAIVAADMLKSRLEGKAARPTSVALILTGAIVLAGSIVALRDPGLVVTLLPAIGAAGWIPLLRPAGTRRPRCAGIRA